ncbi:MAG: OadG family protein [Candidatus Delongbacteria bacterium]
MKKIVLIMTAVIFAVSLSASEITDRRNERFTVIADSILGEYNDAEFKTAVLKTLQSSNATNTELFIRELESIRKGRVPEEEKKYGFDNIEKEFKPGMDGWSVAMSGILVVFIGLVLLAFVVIIFNFALKERSSKKIKTVKSVQKSAPPVKPVPVPVPEDHLVAISAAVELYFRLYLHGRPVGTAASTQLSSTWKSGGKFGIRKNHR